MYYNTVYPCIFGPCGRDCGYPVRFRSFICTLLLKSVSCSGLLAHPPLYSHILACSERRPHPSQKFSPLPTMISVRPPPPIPPTPTGAPTLTASATASSTSTRATIATWRSRGRSIRMCRQVELSGAARGGCGIAGCRRLNIYVEN